MNERDVPAAWVGQEDQRHRMTLEVLADVDAGRVVDHQAILTRADSISAVPDEGL